MLQKDEVIDESILNYENPKYLLCQINQRFIIQAPIVTDIWQIIFNKLKVFNLPQLKETRIVIENSENEHKFYKEKMLESIDKCFELL